MRHPFSRAVNSVSRPAMNHRRGAKTLELSLGEVLGCLLCATTLGCLVICAASATRHSAQRLQCETRLAQLGIAASLYHDAFGRLPAGVEWGDTATLTDLVARSPATTPSAAAPIRQVSVTHRYSGARRTALATLLPYALPSAESALIDWTVPGFAWCHPENADRVARVRPELLCPADGGGGPQKWNGRCGWTAVTNYMPFFGQSIADVDFDRALFRAGPGLCRDQLERGQSQVLMCGEYLSGTPRDLRGGLWGDEAGMCLLFNQWPPNSSEPDRLYPNPRLCPPDDPATNNPSRNLPCELGDGYAADTASPRSRHAGGAQILWTDGRVQLLSSSINVDLWRQSSNVHHIRRPAQLADATETPGGGQRVNGRAPCCQLDSSHTTTVPSGSAVHSDLNAPVQANRAEHRPQLVRWLQDKLGNSPPHRGRTADLAVAPDWWVVAFLSSECPISRSMHPVLKRIASDHVDRPVAFFGILVDRDLSQSQQQQFIVANDFPFVVLQEADGWLSRELHPTHTPEVFLISATGQVTYRGRINDQFPKIGLKRLEPRREDLRLALAAALRGGPIDEPVTAPVGCPIEPVRPTHSNQITLLFSSESSVQSTDSNGASTANRAQHFAVGVVHRQGAEPQRLELVGSGPQDQQERGITLEFAPAKAATQPAPELTPNQLKHLQAMGIESAERVFAGPPTSDEINYVEHIRPLIAAHCLECHRPAGGAPFSLVNAADAIKRADQLADVVEQQLMPPWKPDRHRLSLVGERGLAPPQIELFRRWAAAGAPRNPTTRRAVLTKPTPEDQPHARSVLFGASRTAKRGPETDHWRLGPPDLILEMPEAFSVAADGPDSYRYFVLPTALPEDRLVAAIEFHPGDPAVVHHASFMIDTGRQARQLDAADPGPGYERFGGPGFVTGGSLSGWAMGVTPRRLPAGTGRLLPAGADVILQTHYHPNGQPATDRSRLGIYFAEPNASKRVIELPVLNFQLELPPGQNAHRHLARYRLPVATTLIGLTPHAHLLARSVDVRLYFPDGEVREIFGISDWDFAAQDSYQFSVPLELPAGTVCEVEWVYDNTSANPRNPHEPPRWISWGEESTDEMGVVFLDIVPQQANDVPLLWADRERTLRSVPLSRTPQAKAR